ncbi:MAG: FAD-binding oxidoreductase [Gemmatimonadota bacterium]|nr:FAD-binding oxidoreductase [Gemmatimonadota bacterium]
MTPTAPSGFRGVFRTDALARAVYSEAAGVARIIPEAVAVPADVDDVVTLVKWAAASHAPLVPRGSGSSMANGALGEGVIVDLVRLDRVGAPGKGMRSIEVGAAVMRDRLEQAASREGLSFPIDPSSGAFATIGGMCATHAAGARSVRYGPLRDWVNGAECVFADGTRAWLRRGQPDPAVPALRRFTADVAPRVRAADPATLRHEGVRKESSGYALHAWRESGESLDLIIGSEGTLAIITAVELRLTPAPLATASLLAGFPDLEGAAAAAARLVAQGAQAVELLDRSFLDIAASEGASLRVPAGLDAALLVEVEVQPGTDPKQRLRELQGWCEAGGATHVDLAVESEDERRLWGLRHAASPILNRLAPRLQSMQLVEDGCVPPAHFAEYVHGVREALARARFRGVIFGHAGDAHAHVNALVDVAEQDWRARAERLVTDVTALVARLGGTLAGEHGDGRLRTPLLARTWRADALALFAATKEAFDPAGILNPGVKVPLPDARPLDAIKYDPALPPLPAAARDALDQVVREKAWSRHRLDLIPRA